MSMKPATAVVFAIALVASGCQSAYYSTMEAFGVHKREILVDRVEEGRDAQKEAKTEIVDALEAFKAVTNFEGGEIESVYSDLKSEYESSESAVNEVKDRVASIEDVAEALFKEWETELAGMQDAELRRNSQSMLDETRRRYEKLIASMRDVVKKMEPVLTRLKDHVTYLKHNLNARAVASLEKNLVTIESDVDALVKDMEKSIAEAEAFIEAMESPS